MGKILARRDARLCVSYKQNIFYAQNNKINRIYKIFFSMIFNHSVDSVNFVIL